MKKVCYVCKDCGKYWTSTSRISNRNEKSIFRDSIERGSMRILAHRYKRSKNTIMKIIHNRGKRLPVPSTFSKRYAPNWSGIYVIDGKRIKAYDKASKRIVKHLSEKERKRLHSYTWIVGVDTLGGDIPNHTMAEEETKIDIILHMKDLKEMKYPMKAVVSDGVAWYGTSARKVFGKDIIIQHCTRHFLQRCRERISKQERKQAHYKSTMLIFFIKRIIEADTLDQAYQWLKRLKTNKHVFVHTPTQQWIVKRFKQEAKYLCAHLFHPHLNIPHTNNDSENLIGQAEKRLITIGRFSQWKNAWYYLNAWILWRRFTPFTDCKAQRKNRNGKSPLQLSGIDTTTIDWMDLTQ